MGGLGNFTEDFYFMSVLLHPHLQRTKAKQSLGRCFRGDVAIDWLNHRGR